MNSFTLQNTPSSESTEMKSLQTDDEQLNMELIRAQVTADVYREANAKLRTHLDELQKRLNEVEKRNKELENPRSRPRYNSLNWRGKVIFCLRKWKRPLRLQEIIAELEIMEAETAGLRYQGGNFISVVLAKAVRAKALHIEKVAGTRGAYYGLPEWVDEAGKLSQKMRRSL